MKKELSHETLILNHLTSGKTITAMEALREYGCFRLGARIYDLRKKGFFIASELIILPNKKQVARYTLNKIPF